MRPTLKFLSDDLKQWGYTTFLEAFPNEDLSLRIGNIQSPEILGAFVGGKVSVGDLTADLDIWHDGEKFDAHGYLGILIGDHLYLSTGGKLSQEALSFVAGYVNNPDYGMFTEATIDLDDHSQNGKTILAYKPTFGAGTMDFRSHLRTGTGFALRYC